MNPDVDAQTHSYIATGLEEDEFGVPYAEAFDLYREAQALANVDVRGIATTDRS